MKTRLSFIFAIAAIVAVCGLTALCFAQSIEMKTIKQKDVYQIKDAKGKVIRQFPKSKDSRRLKSKWIVENIYERAEVSSDPMQNKEFTGYLLYRRHAFNELSMEESKVPETIREQYYRQFEKPDEIWQEVQLKLYNCKGQELWTKTVNQHPYIFEGRIDESSIIIERVGNNGRVAMTGFFTKDLVNHLVVYDSTGKKLYDEETSGAHYAISPNVHIICSEDIDKVNATVIHVDRQLTRPVILEGMLNNQLLGAYLIEPTDSLFRIQLYYKKGNKIVYKGDTTMMFDDLPEKVYELWR